MVLVLAAAVALFVVIAGGDEDEGYRVRAIFDNAGFVVAGEEVKVAGAVAGTVESVDVTMPGETATLEGGAQDSPGKAVVVMNITEPGFEDFRSDASCLIRPQSLIGEKFIECEPTQPRAAGAEPPPALTQVPAGEPGEGQRLLPVEQNGKAIDVDLIQNILRRPYADRFRLILNELGAGLAARGDDLAAVVDRANPALRETDKVLAILAQQNQQLASLAQNSDTSLAPLARERTHLTGFMRNVNTTNEAVIERKPEFEEGLQKLPAGLRDVRETMSTLNALGEQGTPLFTDLDAQANDLSRATKKLGPLAEAGIPALETLGDAAQTSGPKLVAADPIIVKTRDLANSSTPVATNLASLLDSFNKTKGFNYLNDFIFNTVGSVNGYDQYGHFLRANLQVTACLDYQIVFQSGCEAFFQTSSATTTTKKCKTKKQKKSKKCRKKKKTKIAGSGATLPRVPGSGAASVDATGDTVAEKPAEVAVDHGANALDFLFGGEDPASAPGDATGESGTAAEATP